MSAGQFVVILVYLGMEISLLVCIFVRLGDLHRDVRRSFGLDGGDDE